MFNKNFADDWIRTADLWCWKQLLYQLSHNHCQWSDLCIQFQVKEKMDEVKDMLDGTKSSVDHLVPKSEEIFNQVKNLITIILAKMASYCHLLSVGPDVGV